MKRKQKKTKAKEKLLLGLPKIRRRDYVPYALSDGEFYIATNNFIEIKFNLL